MSGNNFFSWIRDGVKQSVIMGVSDAIDQLGTPDENDASSRVMAFLDVNDNATTGRGSGGSRRKRLGRSLKDMDAK